MGNNTIKALFIVAGLYDGILGFAFLFYSTPIFEFAQIPLPPHPGYVQFPALLLVVFALMFFRIAANPGHCRELILYGVGLKIAYCGTIFWHHITAGLPQMWLPFAWADLVFLVLFLLAWKSLGQAYGGPDLHSS